VPKRRRVHRLVIPSCRYVFGAVEAILKQHAAFRSPTQWFGTPVRRPVPKPRHSYLRHTLQHAYPAPLLKSYSGRIVSLSSDGFRLVCLFIALSFGSCCLSCTYDSNPVFALCVRYHEQSSRMRHANIDKAMGRISRFSTPSSLPLPRLVRNVERLCPEFYRLLLTNLKLSRQPILIVMLPGPRMF
jgi:hypothetical protein